jgi:hypothetical protein
MNNELIRRGKTTRLNSPIKLTHRTKNDSLTIDQIDPTAVRATKQGKRNRPAVGFYAYDTSGEDEKLSSELDTRYGSHRVDYVLPAGSQVLDLSGEERGTTSRIDPQTAKYLLSNGYSAVRGYDHIGPPEWVILKIVLSGQDATFVETSKMSEARHGTLRAFIRESILSI